MYALIKVLLCQLFASYLTSTRNKSIHGGLIISASRAALSLGNVCITGTPIWWSNKRKICHQL